MHSMFLFFQVEYEVAPDDKRQEEAKEVYEKYLDPKVVLSGTINVLIVYFDDHWWWDTYDRLQ